MTLARTTLLLLVLALAAGCSSGGTLPGERQPTAKPEPEPEPEPIGDAESGDLIVDEVVRGLVEVTFTLYQVDSEPINATVEYSIDNVNWHPATLPAGNPVTGLASSPDGVEHTVTWDSLDLGFRGQEGTLRVVPRDSIGRGVEATAPVLTANTIRDRSARVGDYMIHYGGFSAPQVVEAKTFDLVILHPFSGHLEASLVHDIMAGADATDPKDDVLVLAYISVGEDLRTVGVEDFELFGDPRFVGNGTGPRIDPRGPDADGQSLVGLDPLGLPSNGGTGFASWYLDDNDVDRTGVGDGIPDRNVIFGGAFVNAGDPAWFEELDAMLFDGADGIPGIRELLTDEVGRQYNCDGLFLDTFDTCAPNGFTDETSPNQSEFEWTAAGFRDFLVRLNTRYPEHLVLQNRGLFLYDPRYPHFEVTPGQYVDYVKFESFRLNSNAFEEYDPFFFPDNKFNVTPKVMAEANRPGGFVVLSLGYAEGPGISLDTLHGNSTDGYDTLVEDVLENQDRAGFLHYITDAGVAYPNPFVRLHTPAIDAEPPVWTSTWNDNNTAFPEPPRAPTPRVGIQQAVASPDTVVVRWDVALDRSRVGYALYYQDAPFDFAGDPELSGATRMVLPHDLGDGYAEGPGRTTFPHQAHVTGLDADKLYHFCIRAFDVHGNEESNEVALSARLISLVTITIDGDMTDWENVPIAHTDDADAADSAGPDWREIQIANDDTNLYIRFRSDNAFNLDGSPTYAFSRTLVFLDGDDNASTGYGFGSVGSELLVAGDTLFAQDNGVFNDGFLDTLSVSPTTDATDVEIAIPLSELPSGASRLRLVFFNDDAGDSAPNSGYISYTIVEP
ncbi:MAG: hypothetical protein ACYTGZ_04805 [Planctomycetota bacterium]